MQFTHRNEGHPTMLRERSRIAGIALRAILLAALLPIAAAAAPSPGFSADRHKAAGVACADCHIKGKKPTFLSAEQCLKCHGPATALVEKTANVKPENPHASPHWGPQMDCTVCHRQHEKTVDWCSHCHAYGFKVP